MCLRFYVMCVWIHVAFCHCKLTHHPIRALREGGGSQTVLTVLAALSALAGIDSHTKGHKGDPNHQQVVVCRMCRSRQV